LVSPKHDKNAGHAEKQSITVHPGFFKDFQGGIFTILEK
jgi:hypothetical protein